MIKVHGTAALEVDFIVQLNMSEEQFDSLSERAQTNAIDEAIDWRGIMQSAELKDIDIWDLEEVRKND